jgi:hypothetical protein
MHGSEVHNYRQLGFLALRMCASGTASGNKLSSRKGNIPGKKYKALGFPPSPHPPGKAAAVKFL